MRQPTSIYLRSARLRAGRLAKRLVNRLRRLIPAAPPDSSGPRRASRTVVSMDTLREAVTALGIGPADSVLVHSGISNLGKVVGGPKGTFELIRDCVGSAGHVLYPAFPFDSLMYEYLRHGPEFDVRSAPSRMGALTQYALTAADGMRSVHPTHSILAFGPRRDNFVGEHHLCESPFADRSPFGRLVEAGGKILLLGVGLNSTTSFHRIEDRLGDQFPVRVYVPTLFRVPCIDAHGAPLEVSTPAHDPFISRLRDCDIVHAELLRSGALRELQVGDGSVAVIDAAAMEATLERLLRDQGLTIYGKLWG